MNVCLAIRPRQEVAEGTHRQLDNCSDDTRFLFHNRLQSEISTYENIGSNRVM